MVPVTEIPAELQQKTHLVQLSLQGKIKCAVIKKLLAPVAPHLTLYSNHFV